MSSTGPRNRRPSWTLLASARSSLRRLRPTSGQKRAYVGSEPWHLNVGGCSQSRPLSHEALNIMNRREGGDTAVAGCRGQFIMSSERESTRKNVWKPTRRCRQQRKDGAGVERNFALRLRGFCCKNFRVVSVHSSPKSFVKFSPKFSRSNVKNRRWALVVRFVVVTNVLTQLLELISPLVLYPLRLPTHRDFSK